MHHRMLLGCAVVALLFVACKKKGESIVQSCWTDDKALIASGVGSTAECEDQFQKETCGGVQKKSDKPCARENVVAGCKTTHGIRWFYSDPAKGGYASAQLVRNWCDKGTTVLADGGVAETKSPAELASAELDTYMKNDGPKAKAHLATIAQLANKLPAPTGKLDLGGGSGDAILAHKEDLADPEHPKTIPYRLKRTDQLGACSRLLGGRKTASDQPYELGYCAKSPFLAVVSVSDYSPPTATGSSVSGKTKTTYVKRGRIAGDVLVFRVEDGKYLGSYPFVAENSIVNAAPEKLTVDLLEKLPIALYQKTKTAAPGMSVLFDLQK